MRGRGNLRAVQGNDDILRRLPPQDLQAEQSVLGAILLAAASKTFDVMMTALGEELQTKDFYAEKHRLLYQGLTELWAARMPVDAVTVSDWLTARKFYELVGGAAYVAELASVVPTASNIAYYAQIVRNKALCRQVITECSELVTQAYDGQHAAALLQRAEIKIEAMADRVRAEKVIEPLSEVIEKTVADVLAGNDHAAQTGFPGLDEALGGGFKRAHLIIIGARPSTGKSALVSNIALRVKRGGTLIISDEMKRGELVQRGIADLARIDWNDIRRRETRQPDDSEFERIQWATDELNSRNFDIAFVPKLRARQVRALARAASYKWDGKLDLIIVDYLQRMKPERRLERRDLELGEITDELKTIAGDLDCAVVVCAQLNRGATKRVDPTPTLEDLKDSGATEENADEVLLMWKKPKSAEDMIQRIYLTVAKQRNGPTPTINLDFDRRYTRFEEARS